MERIKGYIIATRPWSFTMSLISVSVGTLLAAEEGPILWGWFALTAIGMVLFHGAANVLNDFFDTRYQVDQADSPTSLYRPHPLLTGMFTRRQLLVEVFILLLMTAAIGLFLSFQRSLLVLWIGLIGFLLGMFYTAWPIMFKYRAWGELAVFIVWGPLVVEGAYIVQRQAFSLKALYISVPFGILVALVLFANNMRDIAYDSRRRVKTLSILMGRQRSLSTFFGLFLSVYLNLVGMIIAGVLSPWCLLVLLSIPKAIQLFRTFSKKIPEGADAVTAQLDTLFGLLLILSLILNKTVPL